MSNYWGMSTRVSSMYTTRGVLQLVAVILVQVEVQVESVEVRACIGTNVATRIHIYIIHTHTFTSNHVITQLQYQSESYRRSAHLSVTPSLGGRRRLQLDVRGAFPLVHMRVPSRPIVAQVRGDRVSCRLYRPRWNPLEPPRRAPSPSLHFYPSVAFPMLQWQCAQR